MIVTLNYAKEDQPIRMINYKKTDVFMTTIDGNVVKRVKQLFLVVSCLQRPLAHKGLHRLHSPLPSLKAIVLSDHHTHPPAAELDNVLTIAIFMPHMRQKVTL